MDFFAVPTVTFSVLYCFFVISHDRRRILHCNVTRHPTSLWIVQQLREAFPLDSAPRFLIFDRDAKYGLEALAAVRSLKTSPVRTSFGSPWQNGIAERLSGQLPPRPPGSRHCHQGTPSQTLPLRLHFLPPRRSHASWTREGNARRQKLPTFWSHIITAATGRVAPSL